jgi:hypothetical protein
LANYLLILNLENELKEIDVVTIAQDEQLLIRWDPGLTLTERAFAHCKNLVRCAFDARPTSRPLGIEIPAGSS